MARDGTGRAAPLVRSRPLFALLVGTAVVAAPRAVEARRFDAPSLAEERSEDHHQAPAADLLPQEGGAGQGGWRRSGGGAALLEAAASSSSRARRSSARQGFPFAKSALRAVPFVTRGDGPASQALLPQQAGGAAVPAWTPGLSRRPTSLGGFVLRPPSYWSGSATEPEDDPFGADEDDEDDEDAVWDDAEERPARDNGEEWPPQEDERSGDDEAEESEAWIDNKQIDTVRVKGCFGDEYSVSAPQAWIRKFKPGSARAAHNWFITGEDYVAQLARDAKSSVVFRSAQLANNEDVAKATGEREIMKRMSGSGYVVQRFAERHSSKFDFVLEEATDDTLEGLVHRLDPRPGKIVRNLPLARSLPLLADILRGARDLEDAGVVHCDLTTEHILLKDGRALMAGFGSASVVNGWDIQYLHPFDAPSYAQPPESASGYPTGPSCNVWAVGRVFARMHMGGDPLREAISHLDPWAADDPFTRIESAIRKVHSLIKDKFDIRNDPVFDQLNKRVQEILPHLLDPNSETRWTAKEALRNVERIAKAEGIDLPPERSPGQPPRGLWAPPLRHAVRY